MAMNSFAILADDVEDADDLAPKPVVKPTPPVTTGSKPKQPTVPSTSKKNGSSARVGPRENGAPPSRGKRGGRGSYRGRGGRGRGGMRGRGRSARDNRGKDADGWEKSRGGPPASSIVVPSSGAVFSTPIGDANGNQNDEDIILPPTGNENANDRSEEENNEEEEEPKGPPPPPDMTLDEYMAQRKETVALKNTTKTRKANETGGKMSVMKKSDDHEESALSIMSAVSRKAAVTERTIKDSTHVAVADNAKNQEFFKDTTFGGRGRGGNRRRGMNRDFRQDNPRNHFGRRRGGARTHAPNVDDTNAFPALSA